MTLALTHAKQLFESGQLSPEEYDRFTRSPTIRTDKIMKLKNLFKEGKISKKAYLKGQMGLGQLSKDEFKRQTHYPTQLKIRAQYLRENGLRGPKGLSLNAPEGRLIKGGGTALALAGVGYGMYRAINAKKASSAPISAKEIDAYNKPALQKRKNQGFRNFVIGTETAVGGLLSTGLGLGGSLLGAEAGAAGGPAGAIAGGIAGGIAGDVVGKQLVENQVQKSLLKDATPYEKQMILSEHFRNTQDIIKGVGTTATGILLANPYLIISGALKIASAAKARKNEKKRKREVEAFIESQKKKAAVEPPAVEQKTAAPAAAEPAAAAAVDPRAVPGTERGYLLK